MRLLFPLVARFVAGTNIQDAATHIKKINRKKVRAIVDHLGEDVTTKEDVNATATEYLQLMNEITLQKLDADISIKLSSFGLQLASKTQDGSETNHVDKAHCIAVISMLVEEAGKRNIFVWIDMESSKDTDATLEIYRTILRKYANVGICLQSYLRRTEKDLLSLLSGKNAASIRLVKGAYKESAGVSFTTKKEVDDNYRKLMAILFQKSNHFHIATHDRTIIDDAKLAARENAKKSTEFSFAMLMGVRESEKEQLAKEGYSVCEYVPYGEQWFPYFSRRIRERKENLFFALRAFFGR